MIKKIIRSITSFIQSAALAQMIFIGVLVAGSIYLIQLSWEKNEAERLIELEEYQTALIKNKTEFLSSQLVDYLLEGKQLVKSRIFRESLEGLASIKEENVKNAVEDFTNFVGVTRFLAGHIFYLDGRLLATTSGRLNKSEASYLPSINLVTRTNVPVFSSLNYAYEQMASDIYLPIYPSNTREKGAEPKYVLVLTVPLNTVLEAFLAPSYNIDLDTSIHIIQNNKGNFQELGLSNLDNIRFQNIGVSFEGVKEVPFGRRDDLYGKVEVLSSATHISAINWWVMAETPITEISDQIVAFKEKSYIFTALGFSCFAFFLATINLLVSTRRLSKDNREMESELQPLRRRSHVLEHICNLLPTPICLKDTKTDELTYLNKPFADYWKVQKQQVMGLKLEGVLGVQELKALKHSDSIVQMSGDSYLQDISVDSAGERSEIQVASLPYNLSTNDSFILYIFRDVTREKRLFTQTVETGQQIINALIKAVESVPFLDGHTSLMRLLSLQIARTLLMSNDDCTTVETAAILSQIGKTFIPKEILGKEGKLTPEEIEETRKYVQHTCNLLDGIEFNLPITEAIMQMQETLDGSGYPNNLVGDEVSTHARILGVANTFSALVQSRSYRKAKTALEAVDILKSMGDTKFDTTVITALEAVVRSPRGQVILTASNVEIS